jgi:predicted Zn finger-like uncharacterized protein
MSLITSCPSCGTMFRVVPDQLKISEGWVRCGHCSEVFDATAHLTDESVLVEPPTAEHATRPPAPDPTPVWVAPGVEEQTRAAEAPTTIPDELQTRPADLATRPAELPTRPADLPTRPADLPTRPASIDSDFAPSRSGATSSRFGPDSQSLEPSPLDSPFVFRRSDLAPDASDFPVQPPEPRDSALPYEEEEEPTPAELQDVSFVRQARRKAFWRRPFVRIALAFVSLALAALLLAQLAYQDRDRLALAEPALRPALQEMCRLLQCTLGPPRQIEAIVIESSGFNRLRNDTFRLAFTLRNTARVPVATPAMELTITDSQDQAIARRVLTPAELGAGDQAIAAAGEWSRSVGLVLDTGGTARVAGYRLLAFYP